MKDLNILKKRCFKLESFILWVSFEINFLHENEAIDKWVSLDPYTSTRNNKINIKIKAQNRD